MPYIDNLEQIDMHLRDKSAMEDFGKILGQNGWTRIKTFYKVVVGRKQYGLTPTESSPFPYRAIVHLAARHLLYKNADGRVLGMAEIIRESKSLTPTFDVKDALAAKDYKDKFKATFDTNKVKGLIYFYTVEKEPSIADEAVSITYPIESLTADKEMFYATALDVEIGELLMFPTGVKSYSTPEAERDMQKNANEEGIKEKADPRVMQSTLVPVELFNTVSEADSTDNVYSALNKWDDSRITIQGRIDSHTIMVVMQSDASANWVDNKYPTVPLFFGEVDMDSGERGVYVLFGGVTPTAPGFAYNSLTAYTGNGATKLPMPVLKAYPSYPGDGINAGVLSKTKGGARYQKVYLSWGTTTDSIPPVREGKSSKKYPRSWDYNVKNYGFNPSRYSGSVHTSYIYVVHPEEGVIGRLQNVVGLQTFATNNPELRIRRENCPIKVTDSYQVMSVSSICPFTKTPATVFSLAGIAIRKSVVESPNYVTVPVPKNVTATTVGNTLVITWDTSDDHFNEGVRIDVDGIEVAPIVSGASRYVVDLDIYMTKFGGAIETVGVTAVNTKGKESDTVVVTL